jgi:hypothetical protein
MSKAYLGGIPDDLTFETTSRAGRLMHEFLGRQKKPLRYKGDFRGIANALIRSGAIVDEYGYQFLDLDELALMLEVSEHWFRYETGGDGKVVVKNRIDWSVFPPIRMEG